MTGREINRCAKRRRSSSRLGCFRRARITTTATNPHTLGSVVGKQCDLAHFADFLSGANVRPNAAWTHLYRVPARSRETNDDDDDDELHDESFYRIRRRGLFRWGGFRRISTPPPPTTTTTTTTRQSPRAKSLCAAREEGRWRFSTQGRDYEDEILLFFARAITCASVSLFLRENQIREMRRTFVQKREGAFLLTMFFFVFFVFFLIFTTNARFNYFRIILLLDIIHPACNKRGKDERNFKRGILFPTKCTAVINHPRNKSLLCHCERISYLLHRTFLRTKYTYVTSVASVRVSYYICSLKIEILP